MTTRIIVENTGPGDVRIDSHDIPGEPDKDHPHVTRTQRRLKPGEREEQLYVYGGHYVTVQEEKA